MAYVRAMGKALKCNIRIVHAVEISSLAAAEENPDILLDSINVLVQQAEKKLVLLKKEIEAFELDCEYDIVKGRTLFLKEYMESLNPLMIVMGTIGKNGLENKIFGSFTAQTIRNPKSIVLAIPQKAKFNRLSDIVFATDFHKKDINYLEFLKKITEYYASNLRVIHISENSENVKQKQDKISQLEAEMTKVISPENLHFELLYSDDIENKLLELLESYQPDMLALITRNRNFIERIFDKSLSIKMVNHTHIPVLVFS